MRGWICSDVLTRNPIFIDRLGFCFFLLYDLLRLWIAIGLPIDYLMIADARAMSGQEDPTTEMIRHEFDREEWQGTKAGQYRNKPGGKWSVTTPEAKPWEGWGTALKPAWEPIIVGVKL